MVAYAIAIVAIWLYLVSRSGELSRRLRAGVSWTVTLVLAQVFLGIVTLLHVVPVALGAAHQAGGMLVLAASLYVVHELRAARAA
jgi:cytochrome c oxidase assembly protein subunit 15